jgi:hypothetical protein
MVITGEIMLLAIWAQVAPSIDQFTNLSMAGLMGAMWLWERRTSRQREQQLDEAHTRILADRVQLAELIDVVQQNTAAITQLTKLTSIFNEAKS